MEKGDAKMNTVTMDISLIILYCVTLGIVICYAYYFGYTNYNYNSEYRLTKSEIRKRKLLKIKKA